MQSFKPVPTNPELYSHSSFYFRGDDTQTRFADLGELDHSAIVFPQDDALDLSSSSIFSLKANHNNNVAVVPNTLHYATFNTSPGCLDIGSTLSGTGGEQPYMYHHHKGTTSSGNNGHFENWGDSAMAEHSQQTDTSTDIDTEDKNLLRGAQHGALVVVDSNSIEQANGRTSDQKSLRRLAQNREAARKSRLRKKAYVQQLENSRLKLSQLEQELQRARQQGMFVGPSGDQGHSVGGSGALIFDFEYARWLDEHQRLIHELRSAVNSHLVDNGLRVHVDSVMTHYDEIFRLKSVAAKADVFHMLSGMWKTPAERCFMWLGGFRSSELLKILGNQLEPLTDQQLMGICNLQQSSQQTEDALSQGMEALQQSLVDTLSSSAHGSTGSADVADYMGQMAVAMGKLGTLQNFLIQADLLRQQTLQQLYRILTTRQAARALLVINDYFSRLRALSSLWMARPRD
ncbi:transcription factor TGA2.2-like [Argentina anserina]|uniref:transcription factor TGA2.2-like n=1 Tax=Argentina anserina TaxID=57926 RepID=UPI002176351F|nr:transcription factor TGA2.2-like [Potentilla anserina]